MTTTSMGGVTTEDTQVSRRSAELLRLDQCAREPIRTPGSIQPHGALLALDPLSFVVRIVSANCADLMGIDSPLLGQTLAQVTGDSFEREVRTSVAGSPSEVNPLRLTVGPRTFDAIVHTIDDFVIVELEPVLSVPSPLATSALYALIHRLAHSTTVEALRADAAAGLRTLTGFDRVMIYHFHPDGHGEIVADDHVDGMEPYGGLHFPASDIPAQARALYLTKLSRAIVNTSRSSVDLLTDADEPVAGRLDLGQAELRSVSPHHLQFMSNMGQESTLSISMVRNGELIGMITCAHRSVLRIPFLLRSGLEVLANQIALQLSALDRVEQLTRQVAVRSTRSQLMSQIAATDDLVASLLRGRVTVQDVIEADGVALRLGGVSAIVGTVPAASERELLITHAERTWSEKPFASDALAVDHPELAATGRACAGVLVLRIGGNGDYLAFFRNEILRSVHWLGDQTSANRNTVLSPRNSFSSWTDSVTDTAEPWGDLVVEAVELARDLEGALLRKAESELAHLAMHDALTGLPNRRNLIGRLELALAGTDARLSLLFIDLDGFKGINDTHGHDVGDSLLTLVGQRIVSATRTDDVVARLGGDEFVVLCEDADAEEAEAIASRVRAFIAEPLTVGTLSLAITASVGTAVAGSDTEASDLLQRADVEMYRAKSLRQRPPRA